MEFNKISDKLLAAIKAIVGHDAVISQHDGMEKYSHDETEDLIYYPEVVVKPASPEQVSALMRFCNENLIPVTPRGAGTGLSGGALAVKGGVLLAMERFDKILNIDVQNLQATVEPGVITELFMDAAAAKGLLYPVDPASKGSCFMGEMYPMVQADREWLNMALFVNISSIWR